MVPFWMIVLATGELYGGNTSISISTSPFPPPPFFTDLEAEGKFANDVGG